MSKPELSERALIGAMLQEHDRVFPICQEAGITAASFTDSRARRVWETMAKLRAAKPGIVDLLTVAEGYGGDSFEAMQALEKLVNECPTIAYAQHYAQKVREAERRRMLLDAAKTAQEQLANGEAIDAVADKFKAAADGLIENAIGGPLVSTFPPMTFSYLRDLEVKPEENHIMGKGWLRRGAWSLFTGSTGIGKSVAVQQMAACVASGKSVFGLSVASPFKVLLLTAEQDEETLQRDFVAIAEHEGLDAALLDANLQIHHAYALDGPPLIVALEAELARRVFDLLILDNYQAFSGAADLNDSAAWKEFIAPLSKLLKQHNAAMLLVDHTGKPRERKGWGVNDSVYVGAGTSRKANGARTSAELYSPEEGDERYKLHFGKNWERTGRTSRALYLDRSPDATRPYWTPSADQTDHKAMAEGEREIVAHATAHPFHSLRQIAEATGYSKSKVDRLLKKHPLLSHGREEKS